MDRKQLFFIVCIFFIFIGTIIFILVKETKTVVCNDVGYETFVNLTNTSCRVSRHIEGRLFLHECVKGQKTVYDLRYFFKDDNDGMLKASIIGVQMYSEIYAKVCNFSLSE